MCTFPKTAGFPGRHLRRSNDAAVDGPLWGSGKSNHQLACSIRTLEGYVDLTLLRTIHSTGLSLSIECTPNKNQTEDKLTTEQNCSPALHIVPCQWHYWMTCPNPPSLQLPPLLPHFVSTDFVIIFLLRIISYPFGLMLRLCFSGLNILHLFLTMMWALLWAMILLLSWVNSSS